ncbi:hypothetical protein [Paenibacillus sp. FSL A5-0031]|nr:hypothetical protein [Paenibacillus sp. FSL A5-0031]
MILTTLSESDDADIGVLKRMPLRQAASESAAAPHKPERESAGLQMHY